MSRAESPLRERMIFAFGARRSGTLWLQRMISAHPEVVAVPSETHLFSHGIRPLMDRFQHSTRGSQQVAAVFVDRDVALDAVRDLCDAVFAQFLVPGATRVCERTAMHVFHLDLIAAVYPDARFVHIVRDGRDVARSLVAQDFGPVEIAEAAGEWRAAIEQARAAGLAPDRYREVRYESLLESPRGGLAELYEWLGLPVSDAAVEQAVLESRRPQNVDRFSHPGIGTRKWRLEFSSADLRAFEGVGGDLLRDLGYEPAKPEELPARRSPRRIRAALATARRAARVRLDGLVRKERGPAVDRRSSGILQQRHLDLVLEAIRKADAAELRRLLSSEALVRVIPPDGRERRARGEAAIELLCEAAATDPALSGRQARGDVFPGDPTFGVLLRYELPDGSLAHRLVFAELDGERCGAVTLYQLPVAPRPAGATAAQLSAE